MAGEFEFSVPSHTTYFAGYLDAVGRHYTDERRLCVLSAAVMPSMILDGFSIRNRDTRGEHGVGV